MSKPLWYSLQYIIVSMILLILVYFIDFRRVQLVHLLPDGILMKAESAKAILSVLAGALLTITTFTFSTILVVITMYASNFSHRVVENFIDQKITMKVLGIYIGGFIYCILSIVLIDYYEKSQVICGFVGVLYSLVCMGYFVRFVQSVIKNFQSVNLIGSIGDEAIEVIDQEVKRRVETTEYTPRDGFNKTDIFSEKYGYVSFIDYEAIENQFEANEAFTIKVHLGDFINEDTLIGTAINMKDKLEDDAIDRIRNAFLLSDKKVSHIDYRYNMTKIYEIAARALSSGVNDPNTAIHCINKLGVLLRRLAKIDQHKIQYRDHDGAAIYYTSYRFREDLIRYYVPLVHYGQSDAMVIRAIISSLKIMLPVATDQNQSVIGELLLYIRQKTQASYTTDLEEQIITDALNINYDLLTEE